MILYHNRDGISCYIISILYILQNIPYLNNFIKDYENEDELLIVELKKLFINEKKITNLDKFKKIAGTKNKIWNEREHQDSHEFYEFLINQLMIDFKLDYTNSKLDYTDSKLCKNNILHIIAMKNIELCNMKEYSPIKSLFTGYDCSEVICQHCDNISPKFTSFITIQLSVSNIENMDLYDALFKYTNIEYHDNIKHCSFCGIKYDHPKKISFWKLPKILVIQLRKYAINNNPLHFNANKSSTVGKKINNSLYYPTNLDLTSFMHIKSPYKKCNYTLYGINLHFGRLDFGHYISYVKENDKWFLYNDSKDPEEIKDIQSNNAYMLFYILDE
jgi:ubiquitin C-terminal hydrolase